MLQSFDAVRGKTSALFVFVIFFLMTGNSTGATNNVGQTLFGQTFPDHTDEAKDRGFAERAKIRLAHFRKYGTTNGLLADELLTIIRPATHEPLTLDEAAAYQELIKIYPLIPSGSQQFLAGELVWVGESIRNRFQEPESFSGETTPSKSSPDLEKRREDIGNGLIRAALDAALANQWLLSSYFCEKLQLISGDPIFKGPVTNLLTREPPEAETTFDSILSKAEKLAESGNSKIRYRKREPNEFTPQCSWYLKFEKAITGPDGRKKENVASSSNTGTIAIATYPPTEVVELDKAISELARSYPKLSEPGKEVFTVRLLTLTSKFQYSNIESESEKLFWIVFHSIDSSWLEENQLGAALVGNFPFFAQTNKLDRAAKIIVKDIEIEDLFFGGRPANSNSYYTLGDLYDRMGRLSDAEKQYEIAKSIDIETVRSGILSADRYMERNYEIRKGTYVSSPGGL